MASASRIKSTISIEKSDFHTYQLLVAASSPVQKIVAARTAGERKGERRNGLPSASMQWKGRAGLRHPREAFSGSSQFSCARPGVVLISLGLQLTHQRLQTFLTTRTRITSSQCCI
ncbi:hypothetical protein H6P81_019831 [Aristolochia fimbriata]|uniref:Uncharacterized protein n=1 Tax=Aristolochia fimbriata TaxID=158543 RepID=A0AAV7DVT7_ARIFI|nr:hypothetical protein H6P81_019831 [Aristolochia fimbriata]